MVNQKRYQICGPKLLILNHLLVKSCDAPCVSDVHCEHKKVIILVNCKIYSRDFTYTGPNLYSR